MKKMVRFGNLTWFRLRVTQCSDRLKLMHKLASNSQELLSLATLLEIILRLRPLYLLSSRRISIRLTRSRMKLMLFTRLSSWQKPVRSTMRASMWSVPMKISRPSMRQGRWRSLVGWIWLSASRHWTTTMWWLTSARECLSMSPRTGKLHSEWV